MAEVKQITTWNGLRVEIGTDPATGNTTWRDPTSGTIWATSAGSNNPARNWEFPNETEFVNAYNSRPGATNQLTPLEFSQQFLFGNTPGSTGIGLGNSGTALGNEVRAQILNSNANYNGDAENIRQSHFNSGIPGVTNPTTGQVINSGGTSVADPNIGGLFQTLENGSPFDLNQNFCNKHNYNCHSAFDFSSGSNQYEKRLDGEYTSIFQVGLYQVFLYLDTLM